MLRNEEERKHASHQMIAVGASLLTLSTAAVAIRFASRRIARSPLWWDDWFALAALCGFVGFTGNIYGNFPAHWNYVQYPASEETRVSSAQALYAEVLLYYFIQFCLKGSILAFYWRLFSSSTIRMPIIITTIIVILWFLIVELIAALQCLPVHSIWTPLPTARKCIDLDLFFLAASIPNILTDLILLLLPMPTLYKLHVPRFQKLFIMCIFSLGIFILFASGFRLYYLTRLTTPEFAQNWMIHSAVLWTVAEHGTGIVCVCLASSRPFFAAIPCVARYFDSFLTGPDEVPSFVRRASGAAQERAKGRDAEAGGNDDTQSSGNTLVALS